MKIVGLVWLFHDECFRKMIKAILMMIIKQNPIETLNCKELSIRDRVSVYFNEAGSEDYRVRWLLLYFTDNRFFRVDVFD